MKKLLFAATCVVLAFSGAANANVGVCEELWVERNSYFKEAGYCFQTPRAIYHFGNGGCRFDLFKMRAILPNTVRDRIAQIVRTERYFGCSGSENAANAACGPSELADRISQTGESASALCAQQHTALARVFNFAWYQSLAQLECAPFGMDRRDAVQMATCRACSSSNLAGLLYPSAEWRRLAL